MRRILLVSVLLASPLAGCASRNDPEFGELLAVSGTVTRGGQPVSGGVVRFHPEPDDGMFIINSEVKPDGKFTLSTVRATGKGERKSGVPKGKYKVAYTPSLGDQTSGGSMDPVELAAPVPVVAPDTGMKIDLPPARKK